MTIVGRGREIAQVDRLLARAAAGSGGVLTLVGPAGSGKTTMIDLAADKARYHGFEVLRGSPPAGQHGRMVWAQLLRDLGDHDGLAGQLLADDITPLDLDQIARTLLTGGKLVLLIDDIDKGGTDATDFLSLVAARASAHGVAVVVTAATSIGMDRESQLPGLSEAELAQVLGNQPPDVLSALWLGSDGHPGAALSLATDLVAGATDPLVQLALKVPSRARFLEVDNRLVRLLELAVLRTEEPLPRARVLARLAYELLGDSTAAARRRSLVESAETLARPLGDDSVLAEVLDARMHALWDAAAGEERVAAADEIVALAQASGDGTRERRGLFWRFVSLMELGRINEAASALGRFEQAARAAGDTADLAMATARHVMLAILRGRFGEAVRLTEEVDELSRRAGIPDAWSVVMNLRFGLAFESDRTALAELLELLLTHAAQRPPGHFMEATAARALLEVGRADEAFAELQRSLPEVLAGSGPRWIGAVTALAWVAHGAGDTGAAAQLYDVLVPYRSRWVIWGGANSCHGPVSHYLGLLEATLGRQEEAFSSFSAAIEAEESIGALPYLARSLAARAELRTGSDDLRRARSIAEQLGLSLLDKLRLPADEWTLRRDGDDWLIEAGTEQARLRDNRGLHYLQRLLQAPREEISVLDLVADGAGLHPPPADAVLDAAAAAAYRERLETLATELAEADERGDQAVGERLEAERQAVLAELRRATGLGGRTREQSAETEKARVNVTRTLRTALDRLAEVAPLCAGHLRASIRTGRYCRYDPAEGGPGRWNL